jgi:hypothetical protein
LNPTLQYDGHQRKNMNLSIFLQKSEAQKKDHYISNLHSELYEMEVASEKLVREVRQMEAEFQRLGGFEDVHNSEEENEV